MNAHSQGEWSGEPIEPKPRFMPNREFYRTIRDFAREAGLPESLCYDANGRMTRELRDFAAHIWVMAAAQERWDEYGEERNKGDARPPWPELGEF